MLVPSLFLCLDDESSATVLPYHKDIVRLRMVKDMELNLKVMVHYAIASFGWVVKHL